MEVFPDIIELNVGGTVVATHLRTLLKDENSMLAAMFSGRHVVPKDKDGLYFIDCDGALFKHILEYLRFGTIPPPKQALDVYSYAEYFGIRDLTETLEMYPQVRNLLRKRAYDADLNQDIHLYDVLKQKVLKELDSFYGTRNVLVSITIKETSQNNCSTNLGPAPCQPIIYGDSRSGRSKSSADQSINHKVSVSVSDTACRGWSKLLALELRELEFSQYTYYLDCEEILKCKRCNNFVGRMEYVLLENICNSVAVKDCWMKP